MGGGQGIGAEISKSLSIQGTKVLVSSRSGISPDISMNYKNIISCKGDLENYDEMLRHAETFQENIEFIYYCVHRPFKPSIIEDLVWDSIEEQIIGTVKPFYNLITAIANGKLNKLKSVLCLSTNTIGKGEDMFAHRNISKGTLETYIKVVSNSNNFKHISFNGVALGYVDTPQLKEYLNNLKNCNNRCAPNKIYSLSEVADFCISIGHEKWVNNTGKIFQID